MCVVCLGIESAEKSKKIARKFCFKKLLLSLQSESGQIIPLCCFRNSSGCSSARLEYTSGGRGVASSNLVTPTKQSKSLQSKDWRLLCYKARSCLHVCGLCGTKVLALQGEAFALFGSPNLRSPSEEPPCVARSEVIWSTTNKKTKNNFATKIGFTFCPKLQIIKFFFNLVFVERLAEICAYYFRHNTPNECCILRNNH